MRTSEAPMIELPALGRCGLQERVGRRCPQHFRSTGSKERRRAAVHDGLRGRDADDEVGLGETAVHPERRPAGATEIDEVGSLRVVHLHPAAEAPRRLRIEQEF